MDQYYMRIKGAEVGPLPANEIADSLKHGSIDEYTLIWKEGPKGWAMAREFDEFKELCEQLPEIQDRPQTRIISWTPTQELIAIFLIVTLFALIFG